ncbi:hypothetical protein BC830DRAFT_1133942 [Chytriomyces sp. MP71]|nr:hypothetical protein BC830DRAFT_1133942 [Chytriomyces sp. MP71]
MHLLIFTYIGLMATSVFATCAYRPRTHSTHFTDNNFRSQKTDQVGSLCRLRERTLTDADISSLSSRHGLSREQCGNILLDLDDLRTTGAWRDACSRIARNRGCSLDTVVRLVGSCQTSWNIFDSVWNGLRLEGGVTAGGEIQVGGEQGQRLSCRREVVGSCPVGYVCIVAFDTAPEIPGECYRQGGGENGGEGQVGIYGGIGSQCTSGTLDACQRGLVCVGMAGVPGGRGICQQETDASVLSCSTGVLNTCSAGLVCISETARVGGPGVCRPENGGKGQAVIGGNGENGNGQVTITGEDGCIFRSGAIYVGGERVLDGDWLASNCGQYGLASAQCGRVIAEISQYPTGRLSQQSCINTAARHRIRSVNIVRLATACKSRFTRWGNIYSRFDSVSSYGNIFEAPSSGSFVLSTHSNTQLGRCQERLGQTVNVWSSCLKNIAFGCTGWGFGRLASTEEENQNRFSSAMASVSELVASHEISAENGTHAVMRIATQLDTDAATVARVVSAMSDSLLNENATDSAHLTRLTTLAAAVTASAVHNATSAQNGDSTTPPDARLSPVVSAGAIMAGWSIGLAALFILAI